MKPWVVMRSHNDMPVIAETLAELHKQTCPFELIVFDNQSTDGTLDEVRKYTDRIVNVEKYVPGQVLNSGMEHTEGEVVVFVNSDCVPQNEHCLQTLVDVFQDPDVVAAFSQQVPRPECIPIQVKDTLDTYGDGKRQERWRNCFSMATSAIRRSVWQEMRFDDHLLISEDIDWTYRARQSGGRVAYVPESIVMHSHNYTLQQLYRRQYKEGHDEANIYEWVGWKRSLIRYSLLPCARQIVSDARYFIPRLWIGAAISSPLWRITQTIARRRGFVAGMKHRETQPTRSAV